MFGSFKYVITNPLQVARKANYSEVTSGGVWDHFITAIAPAIQKWQLVGSEKEGSCDLGHLLLQAVDMAHCSNEDMSEVLLYILL